MKFADPWWLLLLLPVALVCWRNRRPALFFPSRIATTVAPSPRRRAARWVASLRPLALGAIVVALAEPRVGRATYSEVQSGIDIQLVLDTSSSMQFRDLGVNRTRLELVREVLESFVAKRPADRIGLVTFALYPRVVSPLTRDQAALRANIDALQPVLGNSPEDRTAIGVAIAAASRGLAESGARTKVMVLLTDGEQIVHDVSLRDATDYLAAKGIRLYAVAAGRALGSWSKQLESIARTTGGRSFFARDAAGLQATYREIDQLERSTEQEQRTTLFGPGQQYALAAALAFLCCELLARAFLTREAP
jgi:Ca-activated chloride channel homolog